MSLEAVLKAVFIWFLFPLGFAAACHFSIWAIASFVMWDVFWISAFAHRLIFVALCFCAWGALIAGHEEKRKKEVADQTPQESRKNPATP